MPFEEANSGIQGPAVPVPPLTAADGCFPTGRRGASRVRVALPGQIEAVRGTFSITLRSLSRSGAMVSELPEPLRVGSAVLIRAGSVDAFGFVVWYWDGRCGVAFEDEVSQEHVIVVRDQSDMFARMPEHANVLAAANWCRGGSFSTSFGVRTAASAAPAQPLRRLAA